MALLASSTSPLGNKRAVSEAMWVGLFREESSWPTMTVEVSEQHRLIINNIIMLLP